MEPLLFVLVGGLFVGFGLYTVYFGLRLAYAAVWAVWYLARLVRSEPVSLREAPDANPPVEFEGTAVQGNEELLRAPLSGEDCLAYQVQSRYRAGSDGSWTNQALETAAAPFFVEDGGAQIEVDPDGVDWVFGEFDQTVHIERDESLPDGIADRIRAAPFEDSGVDPETFESQSESQLRERRLDPDDEVHVVAPELRTRDRDWGAGPRHVTAGERFHEVTAGEASDHQRTRVIQVALLTVFALLSLAVGAGVTISGGALLWEFVTLLSQVRPPLVGTGH